MFLDLCFVSGIPGYERAVVSASAKPAERFGDGDAERFADGDGSLVVSPVPAEAASVAQLTYNALREAILAMDVYRSDADLRLDEKGLATSLGVSRTPVRQALARLEHEGLVQIVPRRGVYIVRKSKAEIIEMITRLGGAREHGRPAPLRAGDRRGDRHPARAVRGASRTTSCGCT